MADSTHDPAMRRRNKRINAAWARKMDARSKRSRKRVNVRRTKEGHHRHG